MATSRFFVDPQQLAKLPISIILQSIIVFCSSLMKPFSVKIENHYFINDVSFQLLQSEICVVPDAGHSSREQGTAKLLVIACLLCM